MSQKRVKSLKMLKKTNIEDERRRRFLKKKILEGAETKTSSV